MDSRRDFLKKAALLAAGGGVAGLLPASIQKALAIDPTPGSTFLDAEHVVILMQENRSFDHMYGTLRGVRGFGDPRAITLPDGNPVWLQTNAAGETYAPFRLDIKDTRATWMGSLPHGWVDQGGARNEGRHDRWLDFKRIDNAEYAALPLTLGYYEREDLPFFHAFADAFTVCDQNFCSSLTPTIPNRLHLWTGTVRPEQNGRAWANVRNEDLDYDSEVTWTTFPERLEAHNISWCVYQNELSLPTGLAGEADALLTNFGDNVFEWFTQYRVRFLGAYRNSLQLKAARLAAELGGGDVVTTNPPAGSPETPAQKRAELEKIQRELERWSEANFARLPPVEQNLHRKAFTTNASHPEYRELATFSFHDGQTEHQIQVPKGDLLHQFREDVQAGRLPVVSWIVPPERYSDHPCSPWYGAWYLSETLDILTQNPEVWRKTIFILCYDENDGYYDHVPPFVAPAPNRPETGRVSPGIDTSLEYVTAEQHQEIRKKDKDWAGLPGPIGLGFRVPLVIASPWSRGGYVCSQVFDHTSILQFLETFLSHKTGREVREPNINAWRRTVCGDLTAVFRPYAGEKIALPAPVVREQFFGEISRAQFRPIPNDFKKFSPEEIQQVRAHPRSSPWLPRPEPGVRPACALPYELAVDGAMSADRQSLVIRFSAGTGRFGGRSAGAPFRVYAPGKVRGISGEFQAGRAWDYAVAAGDQITETWPLSDFENGTLALQVYGPNGFFREFHARGDDPLVDITFVPLRPGKTGRDESLLMVTHRNPQGPLALVVEDLAGRFAPIPVRVAASSAGPTQVEVPLEFGRSHGWHDFCVRMPDAPHFARRYAGHLENGQASQSDPFMGGVAV